MACQSTDQTVNIKDPATAEKLANKGLLLPDDEKCITTCSISLRFQRLDITTVPTLEHQGSRTVVPVDNRRAFFGCGTLPEYSSGDKESSESSKSDQHITIDAPTLTTANVRRERLDELAVWLRSRFNAPIDLGVSSRLVSKLFLKVFVTEPSDGAHVQEVEPSSRYFLASLSFST
jgi:hypothetical protein